MSSAAGAKLAGGVSTCRATVAVRRGRSMKNAYEIHGDYVAILLAWRDTVIKTFIDLECLVLADAVPNHWMPTSVAGQPTYVRAVLPHRGSSGRQVQLHRVVLVAPEGIDVDHRDGDGLNNRRSNLRFADDSQNQANRHKLTKNSSGYRGVTFHRRCGQWQSAIKVNGRSRYLGLYSAPDAAARAYDRAANELYGEFARVNFPELRAA